jgi:hypothetical protein
MQHLEQGCRLEYEQEGLDVFVQIGRPPKVSVASPSEHGLLGHAQDNEPSFGQLLVY